MNKSKKDKKEDTTKKDDKKSKKEKNKDDVYDYYSIIPPKSMIETDEHREKIQQFKEHDSIQPYVDKIYNDDYACRWLISRQWDVNKAVDMFVTSMKWREENDIGNIIETYPDDPLYLRIKEFWPGSATGEFYTKDGWPIYYERVGIVDPKYLFNQVATKEQLLRYHCYEQETREKIRLELYEKHGYTIGAIFIQDLNGFGWKHMVGETLDCLKLVSAVDQANFPESVRKMYIINAPGMFTAIWKLIKPMIDKRTLTKLAVLGPGQFEEELKAIIPIEELPVWAGGQNDKVAMPINFHKQVSTDEQGDDSVFLTKLKIPPREKKTILNKIRTKNTTIGWKFKLKDNDINFYITYKKNSKADEKVVFEAAKHSKFDGEYIAKHRGLYYIYFDNSYSLLKKKTIRYQTYTHKPESFDPDAPTPGTDENNNNNNDAVEDDKKDDVDDDKKEDDE